MGIFRVHTTSISFLISSTSLKSSRFASKSFVDVEFSLRVFGLRCCSSVVSWLAHAALWLARSPVRRLRTHESICLLRWATARRWARRARLPQARRAEAPRGGRSCRRSQGLPARRESSLARACFCGLPRPSYGARRVVGRLEERESSTCRVLLACDAPRSSNSPAFATVVRTG